jgi:hypothetical protein
MGFYIRKAINLGGGVRLNLSARGLGLSAGVKGFRIGMNGRGTYVHMGRGGLYYRKQFSYSPPRQNGHQNTPQNLPSGNAADVVFTENLDRPLEVVSGATDAQHIADHFKKRNRPYWIPILLGFFAVISLQNVPLMIALVVCCAASFYFIEQAKAKDVLIYDLDGPALEQFSEFVAAFEAYFSSRRIWQYTSRSFTHDLKRNAGANWVMDRKLASAATDTEKVFRTNLSLPTIQMENKKIVFLPDLVVLTDDKSVAAFKYHDVRIAQDLVRFRESEAVPPDAQVIDHAWQYQNKNGGPDRRFKNNIQIPVCLYEEVGFGVGDGGGRVFVKSSATDFVKFKQAFLRLADATNQLREIDPARTLPGAA